MVRERVTARVELERIQGPGRDILLPSLRKAGLMTQGIELLLLSHLKTRTGGKDVAVRAFEKKRKE
jgi:hypothetical protein